MIDKKYPVFICGITGRSGTHFLYDLLRLHSEISNNGPINEDYILYNIEYIVAYSKWLKNRWRWERVSEFLEQYDLLYEIGNGITSFINKQKDKNTILVSTTPSVKNIQYFPKIFPKSKLIILLRDGRSVVESGMKSPGFNWDFEYATIDWKNASKEIIKFKKIYKNDSFYHIVKYENLFLNTEEELIKIFNFIGLDYSHYDFNKAKNLNVRGSSQISIQNKKMNWNRLERTKNFKPTERYKNWSRAKHERFKWIVKNEFEDLGYTYKDYKNHKLIYIFYNILMDIRYPFKVLFRKVNTFIRLYIIKNFYSIKY